MVEQDDGPGAETWIGMGFATIELALAYAEDLRERGFEYDLAYRADTETYIVRQVFPRAHTDAHSAPRE